MKPPARSLLGHQATRVVVAWLLPLPFVFFQWLFWDLIQPYTWPLVYPLIFFAALMGGAWGGVGATFVSAVLVWYLFLPPHSSFAVEQTSSVLSTIWFVASGIVFSLVLERVRRRDAGYRALFAMAGDGIARVDRMGRYRDVNAYFCELLGCTRHEIVGRYLSSTMVDNTLDYRARIDTQRAAAEQIPVECLLRRKNGTPLPVEMTAAAVGNQEYLIIVRDITERKRAEDALRNSEQNYRELYDHSPDMYLSGYPADHVIRDCNMTLADSLGYTKAEIIGQPNQMLFDSASFARMRRELPKYAEVGGYQNFEVQLRHKDGSTIDALMSASIKPVSPGGPLISRVTLHNITERKRAELALATSEARVRTMIENSPDVIWRWDQDGRLLFVSQALQTHYGITPELMLHAAAGHYALAAQIPADELTAERLVEAGAPSLEFANNWLQAQEAVHTCGQSLGRRVQQEGSMVLPSGEKSFFHSTYQGFHPDGLPVEVLSTTHDVTALVQATEQVRAALQQIKLTADAAEIGTWQWNFDDDPLIWDERIYAFYGVPVGQPGLVHDIWRSHVHPDDIEQIDASLAEAQRNGQEWSATFRILLPDGRLRYMYSAAVIERNPCGEPVRMIGINRDITDQKMYEQYLRDTNELLEQRVAKRTAQLQESAAALARANVGKDAFMAAVSHELRTPLTAILGMADALEQQTRGALTEHQARYVGLIRSSGQRLLELVNGVLFYTNLTVGQIPLQREACPLADLCAASVRSLKGKAAQKQQTIAVEVDPANLTILSDADLLIRMLILLLDNAIKFTGQQGALGVRVSRVPTAEAVRIVVWDQGMGIEAEQIPYLLDPFTQIDQSLARHHEGVGIGLASVRKLVELLGGSVTVESEVGRGSQVSVTLPLVPGQPVGG